MTPRASILYDFCTIFDVFFYSFCGSLGLVSARLSHEKTKTERQGDRDIQHKGHIWGKAERGTKAPPSCSFAPNPLPGQGPGGGAGGQPLNALTQECSRHGGGDGPQGNWIYIYMYTNIYIYIYKHLQRVCMYISPCRCSSKTSLISQTWLSQTSDRPRGPVWQPRVLSGSDERLPESANVHLK